MGGGTYSLASATTSRMKKGVYDKPVFENFQQREVHREMKAVGIELRESRDSDEHPNSFSIIIGLDVTGSMGSVPQMLVRDGLPNIMGKIIENGEFDPQVLFLGIGDHVHDRAPLQVGQFESSDEKLDYWLENTWLEGGGGGNTGESYLLAHYFAARHTSIDCFEKRGRKGLLITIGDEPPLRQVPADTMKRIMGEGQFGDIVASDILGEAQEFYDVYHIHLLTGTGNRYKTHGDWPELLGDNVIVAQSPDDVAQTVIDIVKNHAEKRTIDPNVVDDAIQQSEQEVVL